MTLPKKMFDNILMEIDPTIAAVSVMQIILVSVVLVLIGRFGRGLRAVRDEGECHGRQRLPQGLQVDAVVVGVVASQQRAEPGPAAQDRRAGGRRGLWRPVDGAGAGAFGHRRDRAGTRRLRHRRLDPQRRRRQRRHDHGQGLLRQGRRRRRRGEEEDHAAHAGRRGRFAGPGRDGDPARGHRVLLAHERPVQRRLHAAALCRAGGQGRHLQCKRQPRHLHGAAGAPARGDRPRTTITAAWWWSERASSIRRCTTADC